MYIYSVCVYVCITILQLERVLNGTQNRGFQPNYLEESSGEL